MKEYFVFREEWYELRKTLSKNAWYELETLMLQLRWDGVDTDPKTIKNKTVRTLWVSVRQRILDSMENCERKKKQRAKNNTTNNGFQKGNFKGVLNADNTNYQNTIESTPIAEEQQTDTQDAALKEWVIATTNKIFDLEDQLQNIGKEVAIMQIEKTIADLGTDTKDALDFKKYMTERITDSIRQKRYE